MKQIILLLLLLVSVQVSICTVLTAQSLDVNDRPKLCCPLEWQTVSCNSDELKYAITVNTSDGEFYLRKQDDGLYGFLSYTSLAECTLANVTLLTNPHRCSIVWIDREFDEISTKGHLYIPLIAGMSVSRSTQEKYDYSSYGRRSLSGRTIIAEYLSLFRRETTKSYDLCSSSESYRCEITSRSILHIDCMESMKTILRPQLRSIDFDNSLFDETSLSLELSPQKMTNEGNSTIEGTYYSEINLPINLQINLKPENYTFLDYLAEKTDISHYSIPNQQSPLASTLQLPMFRARLQDIHSAVWPESTSKGLSIASLNMNEAVSVSPQSRCEFSTTVNTFRGNGPVRVTLSIAPRTESAVYWTKERIISALKSIDIDTASLKEQDGSLVFEYSGSINATGFFGHKLLSKCESITVK